MFGGGIWAIRGWACRGMSGVNDCYGVYVNIVPECDLLW